MTDIAVPQHAHMWGKPKLMSTRTMAVLMAHPATLIAIGSASCVNSNSSRPRTHRTPSSVNRCLVV